MVIKCVSPSENLISKNFATDLGKSNKQKAASSDVEVFLSSAVQKHRQIVTPSDQISPQMAGTSRVLVHYLSRTDLVQGTKFYKEVWANPAFVELTRRSKLHGRCPPWSVVEALAE